MKSLAGCLTSAVLCAAMMPVPVLADPDWNCLERALREELHLKLKFQDDFAELVSAERSDFAEVASLGAAASKLNFRMRFSRIAWHWETNPERFTDPNSLWVFVWSDDDMAQWLEADPDNPVSNARFEEFQASLRNHPGLPDFRTFVSDNRTVSPFLELYVAFGDEIKTARENAVKCF